MLQDRQLPELADALRTHGVDSLRVVDIGDDERSAMNTLVVSLEVSIDHLRRRQPDAVALFCLMGLLPGGALDSDFDGIWGSGEGLLRVVSWLWPRVVSPVKQDGCSDGEGSGSDPGPYDECVCLCVCVCVCVCGCGCGCVGACVLILCAAG